MKGIRSKLVDGIIVLATLFAATVAQAQDKPPLWIGVIAEFQAIAGASIPGSAQIAADEINASGGVDGRKIELVIYDDHAASTEAVRAFQRAVSQDKVNVVIASYARDTCWHGGERTRLAWEQTL